MDEALIRYANFAVETFKIESVTFMNVMDTYDIPDELTEVLESETLSLEDVIYEELQDKVNAIYTKSDLIKPKIVLETGVTTEKIIHYARKNDIDLCILGKKIGYQGSGGVVKHIVGLIPASVLMVTETTIHAINKILVRTNFAKPSYNALLMAQKISEYTGASIELHYVYKLPYNYFPEQTPKALGRIREKLDPYVEKQINKFRKRYKISEDIPFQYSVNLHGNEAESLYKYAVKSSIDLILTGTKQKSQIANIMLDSTSAKLASVEKNIPVLVVKDFSESIGFLKALFEK
jgi:nucleotide-binding universal stress UspA family protein